MSQHLVSNWVSLSNNYPDYAPFSFWKYEDMSLINQATGEALTQTDDGLMVMPLDLNNVNSSQQWILDFNSKNFNITVHYCQAL